MSFDWEKFKRLVHYVIWRAGDRSGFGATKLNKVLWFAEARTYMLRGTPITGAEYIRQKYGPVPKAFVPAREELKSEGLIRVWQDRHYNRTQTRFKALRQPDTTGFTEDELKTVDWWIDHIDKDHTATSISDESHDYAWEIAKEGEVIPYYAFFASRVRDPNEAESEWVARKVKELGLP